MTILRTISSIPIGTSGVLSENVKQISDELGQKSKDFTSGKINTQDRGLLLRTLREQRKVESQKKQSENEKSFNSELNQTLAKISGLMTEFISRQEFTDVTIGSTIKNATIDQFTRRLEILLNTKHGDRNVLGGDGVAFDLSKATWVEGDQKLENMNWINLPRNVSTQNVNNNVIKIVEALAEFKLLTNTGDFNNKIKPKIRNSIDQLTFSLSEVKAKVEESDAKIKLHEEKIVALQEEIEKVTRPDTSTFLQKEMQGRVSRLNISKGISGVYNRIQSQLIKGY